MGNHRGPGDAIRGLRSTWPKRAIFPCGGFVGGRKKQEKKKRKGEKEGKKQREQGGGPGGVRADS